MEIRRIFRHMMIGGLSVRSAFPLHAMQAIEQAIRMSEASHGGQIRFAVEGALDFAGLLRKQTAAERAIEIFSRLRVWDTEHNNGVLIYLLLADRDVEIVADRGIHARVGVIGWEAICQQMEESFRQGQFEAGVIAGIHAVGAYLLHHYSGSLPSANELPDQPVVL